MDALFWVHSWEVEIHLEMQRSLILFMMTFANPNQDSILSHSPMEASVFVPWSQLWALSIMLPPMLDLSILQVEQIFFPRRAAGDNSGESEVNDCKNWINPTEPSSGE